MSEEKKEPPAEFRTRLKKEIAKTHEEIDAIKVLLQVKWDFIHKCWEEINSSYPAYTTPNPKKK